MDGSVTNRSRTEWRKGNLRRTRQKVRGTKYQMKTGFIDFIVVLCCSLMPCLTGEGFRGSLKGTIGYDIT